MEFDEFEIYKGVKALVIDVRGNWAVTEDDESFISVTPEEAEKLIDILQKAVEKAKEMEGDSNGRD
jgi:hypothetical protein